jgi:hypothetical protein
MNYVYISPGFPQCGTHFCKCLADLQVRVLGIGDMPYDALNDTLKNSLTEYYYVSSLEDYDQVYRGAAFFIHKYGRLDWIESMNEHWLPTDARLRSDFNVQRGPNTESIQRLIRKSEMKKVFEDTGIPTARQHIVTNLASGKEFASRIGYPLIAKPDIGVGACGLYKLNTEEDLEAFYREHPDTPYVIEEFLYGDICTYDAVVDAQCEPLFESMNTYAPVIDAVQNDDNVLFYTTPAVPDPLRELGRRTVKAFGEGQRFIHFEFIRLAKDYDGIGKAGDYAAMEVNMRPPGGHDPDMINYAQSIDAYRIYAEMATLGRREFPQSGESYYCAYIGRKDSHTFHHTEEEILSRYGAEIVMQEEMPPIDWPAMGRYVYMAKFRTKAEMDDFAAFVLEG